MKKILVIEDDESIRENTVELLEDEGYDVTSAANGLLGIECARKSTPDLIISDVMMPEMDGYGVLKTLRSERATATTPFIFLSAKADKVDFRTGMELGADDYLTKPFTQEDLLQAITLRLSKQTLVHEESERKMDDLRKNISYALPHELRTPLTGILGTANLVVAMIDQMEKSDILRFMTIIQESGERLERLIQNFLLYAQLEMDAGDAEQIASMRKGRTLSAEVVMAKEAKDRAMRRKRTDDLKITLADASVAMACVHLEKICCELVDNAFKYSNAGDPVEVTGTQTDTMYTLTITDRGKGMSLEDIGKVGGFVQFKRKLYEQQGAGLGLAITKRLIELHGGSLTIVSEPDVKTIISAMLPLLPHS